MKARIPKHREFVIDIQEEDEQKKQACWDALQVIMDAYKQQGKSVFTPSFIEDNEEQVKALQETWQFTYTVQEK